MNYVEYLALAVFGRTVADTIHGCKKYENLHTFLPVRCKRHFTQFTTDSSPYKIPRIMVPTYRDRSNGMLMGPGVENDMSDFAITMRHK